MSRELARLILENAGGRGNTELSRDCGGVPTQSRIWQMLNNGYTQFPGVDVIRGLSRGLNISTSRIVQACAEDLGIPMGRDDESTLTIAGGGELDEESKRAIVTIARNMLTLQEQVRKNTPAQP